jgi:hypothetical protein
MTQQNERTIDGEALTETQHLLSVLAEECDEIGQRVTKALRFGLSEIQPGQDMTNETRITLELCDLWGTIEMLQERGILSAFPVRCLINRKKQKVATFMKYADEIGMIRHD